MRHGLIVAVSAFGLVGCTNVGRFIEPPAQTFVAQRSPEVVVNAPRSVVESVIVDGASARGSRLTDVGGGGFALEAPLDATTPEVAAACGQHQPGRMVRVILRASEQGERTRLSEERFIVDRGRVCPMPLVQADVQQAISALSRVKATAESIHRRFLPPGQQRNT